MSVKEGTQTNRSFVGLRRSFSTNICSNNLDERVLATELTQMVEKYKNKDGRYGNLIQIIGSFPTVNLAYLINKRNFLFVGELYDGKLSRTVRRAKHALTPTNGFYWNLRFYCMGSRST